jgi:UPF0042 nucleotide-binding protein
MPNERIAITTFGFKYKNNPEAAATFDVRDFPNPFRVPELKAKDGRELEVMEYIFKKPEAQSRLNDIWITVISLFEAYASEGPFTVAIGCTGGHHRSVAVAEALKERLSHLTSVSVTHRELSDD